MRLLPILCVLFLTFPAFAQDKSDHPLVTAYQGSSVYSKDVKEYDEYKLFMGWNAEAKAFRTERLEGKVTKIAYRNPEGRSQLELYRNYETALKQEGVDVLFSCNQADMECVGTYVGATLRMQFNINGIENKTGRYMVSRLDRGDQTAYLILGVGDKWTDVHVVEMKRMETGMVSLNMAALAEGIDRQGFVVLDGLYFDTDQTVLKPESRAALEQVAAFLKERSDLAVFVVGHTDSQGGVAHNLTLSKGRADAVVAALANDHGIDKARLEGHGVGPLVPEATNADDGGRAKNRRVILVAR